VCEVIMLVDVAGQSKRGKRSKAASSVNADMDGVCIAYTRSQPPSTARVLDNSENVFIGAFPHSDHWLTPDRDHTANDLFEKASQRMKCSTDLT